MNLNRNRNSILLAHFSKQLNGRGRVTRKMIVRVPLCFLAVQSGYAQENRANGLRLLAGWGQRRIKRD